MHLVEEEFFYSAFVFFSCALAEKFFALPSMSQALVVVVDIQDDFVLEIHYFILVFTELNTFLPFSLQFDPFLGLKIVDCLSDALH